MITIKELVEILTESKLKFVFDHWKEAQALPYLVYSVGLSYDLNADNQNYLHMQDVHVELYQDAQLYDHQLEKSLRVLFHNAKVPFRMSEIVYIESERMYLTTLTIQVIEKDI